MNRALYILGNLPYTKDMEMFSPSSFSSSFYSLSLCLNLWSILNKFLPIMWAKSQRSICIMLISGFSSKMFVKKTVIFLWKYLGSIVENKLIVYIWICLWSVFFDLPVCSSYIQHTWLDYCSFSVNLEIRLYNYSILIHLQNCFVYSKSFVFLENI